MRSSMTPANAKPTSGIDLSVGLLRRAQGYNAGDGDQERGGPPHVGKACAPAVNRVDRRRQIPAQAYEWSEQRRPILLAAVNGLKRFPTRSTDKTMVKPVVHLTRNGLYPESIGSGSSPRSKAFYEVRTAELALLRLEISKPSGAGAVPPSGRLAPGIRIHSVLRLHSEISQMLYATRRRIVRAQDEPACCRFGEGLRNQRS